MKAHIDHKAGNALLFKFALAILVFTFSAFALKALIDPERLARYTPLVIVHGAIMMGWMAMFVSQARLAMQGKLASHRAMGRWSPVLVIAMAVTGLTVSWNLAQEFNKYDVLIGNIGVVLTFVPLYIGAILFAKAHRQAEHRMAMLLATVATLGPAYARVTDVLDWPLTAGLPMQLVVTIGSAIWLDMASRGTVAKSTVWLLAFYLGTLFATAALFFMVLSGAAPV